MNAKSNSNILFYGYTSIISGLSRYSNFIEQLYMDITRIKNSIIIYDLLNKNIAKLIPYTLET
jgi:hypothetical protein